MVHLVVIDFIRTTSGHLLLASTITSHMLLCRGPQKSMWMRCHTFPGVSHWCRGTFVISADLPQTSMVSRRRGWRPSHVGFILSSPDQSARSLPNTLRIILARD
ncbi:hypothetical protein L596_020131 [Steinernema carpocapsae]|uniref:Uncharacterized protein n=1 Tax=Steinernema carpocapsae TaxID=34508 RepID=A0A4U5MSR7_STECR|nr:hypothetical protein L596_020131 [Steinernema carpocapsae]